LIDQKLKESGEQIGKLQVERTSPFNDFEGLKCAQKEINDCLNSEREKNNVLKKTF